MSPRKGWDPAKRTKGCGRVALPKPYIEVWAFLGFMGHYWWFIKGFAHIAQPLNEHLSGEDASKMSEWVMLMAEAKDAFETFKKACLKAPALAFANFDKPFLLETDASKLGLGALLSLW